MTTEQKLAAKRAAGEAAAALVQDGMRVGLGTGSTTAFAIEALGLRIREENLRIVGTPTSFDAERLARQYGVPLASLNDIDRFDIALDGADEVDQNLDLIKGRGAALTREKVIASLASRFVVLVDPSKRVEKLGSTRPLPVEILPMASEPIARALRETGARTELRMGLRKDGPVVTDQGFWIIDAFYQQIDDPIALGNEIIRIPGVLEHGLFVGMATDVLIGEEDGDVRHLRRPG